MPRTLVACCACHAGYATGDPAKRVPASVASSLIYLALILVTAAVGLKTATGL